jgi:hypothetical protein
MAKKKPALKVAEPDKTGDSPPPILGQTGVNLWQSIMSEHDIDDGAAHEVLLQVCAAADTVAACDEAIRRDGLMISTKYGMRDNPLLKHQLQARSFITRGLQKLGVLETKRLGPGRPGSGGIGITFEQLQDMRR